MLELYKRTAYGRRFRTPNKREEKAVRTIDRGVMKVVTKRHP
ncbi:hypothetical protein SAMN05421783_101205 [Thiocapsa roseopersicina]|uniref:Uncharacterized protein n=1 Tax=Thiocapsa roseopersicina TaxID=1058 RepID=A0A1H2QDM9_THIRO|nr:hypothetical protein SAMN05421783_101205 [Thiocapsa roseopersicina]